MPPVFYVLIVIWVVAYVMGYRGRVPDSSGELRIPLWTKLVMIGVTLMVAALLIGGSFPFISDMTILLVAGLLAGALGDLILARVIPGVQPELVAMAVFGIGHLFYIAAILLLGGAVMEADVISLRILIAIGISLVTGMALWRVLVYNPTGKRSLNTGSLIYGLVLTCVVGLALNLWLETGLFLILVIGIALFALSDILLAQSMIREQDTPLLRDIVWIIYSGGQMLIAFSLITILTVYQPSVFPWF